MLNWIRYACETMLEHTEIALKALRALLVQDAFALAEMALLLFHTVTMALKGILLTMTMGVRPKIKHAHYRLS